MKSNWRRLLVFLSFLVIMVLVIINLGQFKQFLNLIKGIKIYVFVLMFGIQAVSYYANAKYYESVLAIYKYQVPFKRLYELALSVQFVNTIFPSGGLSGASHLSHQLLHKVPVGKTTLMQLLRYFFLYISFLAVLGIGFLMLFWGGGVNRITVRILLLIVLAILIGSALFLVIIRDRNRVEQIMRAFANLVNFLSIKFTRKKKIAITDDKLNRFVNEFYHGYQLILEDPKDWLRPLTCTLLGNVAEVLTLFAVFLAFGFVVNLGTVIIAYTLANVFSLISVFAGGIGFYEATMVAAFAALGLPLTMSFSVTLVYRIFNFWVFLPFGFYFYRKHSREDN